MASISKNNHRETAKRRYRALPPDDSDDASVRHGITFVEMSNDQND